MRGGGGLLERLEALSVAQLGHALVHQQHDTESFLTDIVYSISKKNALSERSRHQSCLQRQGVCPRDHVQPRLRAAARQCGRPAPGLFDGAAGVQSAPGRQSLN